MAKKKTTKAAGTKASKRKASKTKAPPKRKTTIPESQRRTERVVLRLDPEVAARLRSIASAWHVTLAEVVTDALDALKKKPAK
jgi:hypothetical protein